MSQATLDTITSAAGGGSGLFLRKATGLVREISGVDAFLINAVGMNVGLGALFFLLQAPGFFPAGNMLVATLIGTLLVAFTITWVYTEFSTAMPRSGGDYVFTSRTLHPFIGWVLGWNQAVWLIFFWIGFNAWAVCTQALPTFFSVLGSILGNDTLSSWAGQVNQPVPTFVIGTLINLMFAWLVLTRRYWGWQRYTIALAFAAVLIPALFLFLGGGGLQSAWDSFVGKTGGIKFEQVIPAAQQAGYQLPSTKGFDLGQTLLMLPWVFFVVGFGVTPAQLGGEVKRAGRTMWYALFGAVLLNGLALFVVLALVTAGLGIDWVGSLAFLASNQPPDANALQGLPISPGVNFLGSVLAGNVIVVLIIGLGYVAWSINGTPASELQATRYMLAGALDRMVPRPLGEVDETYHSPRNGVILCTIGGEIAILALIAIPQASLLGALLAQLIAYIIVGIAGALFPYRMRDTWQAAGGRTFAGIPLITIAGVASVVVLGAMLINWITNDTINSFFGVTRDVSLIVTAAVVGSGIVWYVVAWFYNRRRGVDPNLVYRAIPPE